MLLTHALRARRLASGSTVRVRVGIGGSTSNGDPLETVEIEILAPGADALLSPTLAAFLSPRYPFRARTRRNALAAVARAATATRRCSASKAIVRRLLRLDSENAGGDANAQTRGNREATVESVLDTASASARALDESFWPALASLLASDHPARRDAFAGERTPEASAARVSSLDSLRRDDRDDRDDPDDRDDRPSGCSRAVIEACARVMSALLASRVWSWGRAERDIVAPHARAALFGAEPPRLPRAGRAPIQPPVRVRRVPSSGAGAGAPLLKLWALAALDPAAAEGSKNVSAAGGFGRARARQPRAARDTRRSVLRFASRVSESSF